MSKYPIYDRINNLLKESGCEMKVSDIKGLEDFLNNQTNTTCEAYEDIKDLYDQLMIGPGMW